jgi:predicted site-specific integrase-resolvase
VGARERNFINIYQYLTGLQKHSSSSPALTEPGFVSGVASSFRASTEMAWKHFRCISSRFLTRRLVKADRCRTAFMANSSTKNKFEVRKVPPGSLRWVMQQVFRRSEIERIYCRVSSTRQKNEGSGLESQEHRCRQYAEERKATRSRVFPDDATGGGDFMKRPGMVALLAYLDARKPGKPYVVIFDDLKRFARDTEFHIKLRREFQTRGARIECLNFKFEDTPEGKFIETVIAAQGELEREQNRRQVPEDEGPRREGLLRLSSAGRLQIRKIACTASCWCAMSPSPPSSPKLWKAMPAGGSARRLR